MFRCLQPLFLVRVCVLDFHWIVRFTSIEARCLCVCLRNRVTLLFLYENYIHLKKNIFNFRRHTHFFGTNFVVFFVMRLCALCSMNFNNDNNKRSEYWLFLHVSADTTRGMGEFDSNCMVTEVFCMYIFNIPQWQWLFGNNSKWIFRLYLINKIGHAEQFYHSADAKKKKQSSKKWLFHPYFLIIFKPFQMKAQ